MTVIVKHKIEKHMLEPSKNEGVVTYPEGFSYRHTSMGADILATKRQIHLPLQAMLFHCNPK